jgi:hypothetical protein
MKEYQVVIVRLQGKAREDEESLTDLLNERARMGWSEHTVHHVGGGRLLIIFTRSA